MIKIEDLSYWENLPNTELIIGSAGAEVVAYAAAEGDSTYADTLAKTNARELKNGITLAWGRGRSLAIGDNPTAIVGVDGEGDIVRGKTKTRRRKNAASARGWVVAVDFPNI